MSAVDLYGEARRALAHPDAANLLAPLGLDPETESAIGLATVRRESDGLYVPDVDGKFVAAILPVMPDDDLIDLVAVDIANPERWRRRTGLGAVLGEANTVALFGEPLLVHPGPIDWLRAGGDGVAVLECTPTVRGLLNSIEGGLDVIGNLDFAEALERRLTEPIRRPKIYIRQPRPR